jgi:hypothetical protein
MHLVTDEADLLKLLAAMLERAERGIVEPARPLRVHMKDGTVKDYAIGGTVEEQQQVLAAIYRALGKLH